MMDRKSIILTLLSIGLFFSCTPRQAKQETEDTVKESCFYHTVKYSGETLAAISNWYTGSASNWTTILAANEGMNERRITLGTEICIPSSLVKKEKPFPKPVVKIPEFSATEPAPVNDAIQETKPQKAASLEDEVRESLMTGEEIPTEQVTATPSVLQKPQKSVNQDEDELRKTRERLLREMLLDE